MIETPEERKAKTIKEIMNEPDNYDYDYDVNNHHNETLQQQQQLPASTEIRQQSVPSVAGSNGVAKMEQNGSTYFSWTQTEEELEVVIPLSSSSGNNNNDNNHDNDNNTDAIEWTSKDVRVQFRSNSLRVVCKKLPLLDIRLFEHIDVDGSTWTLEKEENKNNKKEKEESSTSTGTTGNRDNKKKTEYVIVITMEKVEQALWSRIVD